MTQNTEQNVRTRDQEILYLAGIFDKAGFMGATSKAQKVIAAAEARGAEEQRRKDGERLEWLIRHMTGYELRRLFGVLSYTGDMPEIFNQIDAAMDAEERG